jgi:hypothetical protein
VKTEKKIKTVLVAMATAVDWLHQVAVMAVVVGVKAK